MTPFTDNHPWPFPMSEASSLEHGFLPLAPLISPNIRQSYLFHAQSPFCSCMMMHGTACAYSTLGPCSLHNDTLSSLCLLNLILPEFLGHKEFQAFGYYFSASLMGAAPSTMSPSSPLGCLLDNLRSLHLAPYLRNSKHIHLFSQIWPQYLLDNQSK